MIITSSEVKQRLSESELLIKYAAEIEELKSQVADLQDELGNTIAIKNRQVWEIRFLKEDIKRLYAEIDEKRCCMQLKDTED